jgi:hypothetical protein
MKIALLKYLDYHNVNTPTATNTSADVVCIIFGKDASKEFIIWMSLGP